MVVLELKQDGRWIPSFLGVGGFLKVNTIYPSYGQGRLVCFDIVVLITCVVVLPKKNSDIRNLLTKVLGRFPLHTHELFWFESVFIGQFDLLQELTGRPGLQSPLDSPIHPPWPSVSVRLCSYLQCTTTGPASGGLRNLTCRMKPSNPVA